MGRSKFPGKPSKSVVKERIRVLYKNKNGKSDKDKNKNNASEVIQSNGYCFQNNFTQSNNQPISDTKSKNITNFDQANKWNKSIKEPPNKALDNENDQSQKESLDDSTKQWGQNVSSLGSCARSGNALSPNICSMEGPKYLLFELDKLIKKKTVTFQNVLETSDDSASCKKIHNPLNKGPLVSIMKKDCLTSPGCIPRGDVIVRPSRLTEILKNNENIDKTKSLSFRSVRLTSKSSDLHDGPNNEISPNIQLSNKGIKQNEINSKKENENVELQPKANHSRLHSKPLVKWKMDKVGSKIEDDEMLGDLKNDICKRSPKRKNSTVYNKIILRQPRLHFEPQCEMPGKQNEISIENNNGNSVSNNLCSNSVCGVCGTTVNSKNLQNRKYGVIACDACRKFMSKITKKTVSSTSNPTTTYKIQCSKRDGECLITSVPKNNVKSFKKIYEERCTACWLKKCIKAFHFPSGHKLRLNAILSETHKNEMDEEAANKNSDLPYHSSAEQDNRSDQISNNSNTNSEINSLSWRVITTSSGYLDPLKSYRKELTSDNFVEPLFDNNVPFEVLTKSEEGVCSNRKGMRLQLNEMPNKSVEPVICKSIEFQSANPVHTLDYPKRQKMNFRGPRVKHVCRSASIALGQQIATFTNDIEEEKTKLHSRLDIENNTFTNSVLGNIYFSKNVQENWPTNPNNALKESGIHFEVKGDILKQGFASNTVKMKRQLPKMPFPSAENPQIATIDDKQTVLLKNTFTHRQNACQFQKSAQSYNTKRNLFMLTHRNISSISKTNLMRITKTRNSEKKSQIISIDFWDTYVAAEVNQTGFGLILTEPSPICALCFVCGSMDVDYLIFCASCCEPYHSYCVQEEITPIHTIFKEKRSNMKSKNDILIQLNWVCPRCTICFTCNMSSGAKIKCQKCKKNYHSTCLGTAKGLLGADRPLICRSCLKCHTCSTTKVSKYVGNQPLCMQCFKLRISESRCPFCNNMFDNILELIILECGICEKLIHAKCEGLTEEQSYLLSNLPEKITFVCKKCSLTNDNAKVLAKQWREAIYEELKTGLLDVLKLLSRSRQANILKRNTAYNCQCDFQHSKKKPQKSPYGTETCNLKTNEDIKKWNRALNHSDKSEVFSTCDCIIGTLQKSKLSLFDVKKKIINGDYVSLFDFNADMNDIIMPLKNDDLILAYKEILSEKFSWFQNETKTCTDALEEDMFESYNYTFQSDDMIIEDQINTTKIKEPIGKLLNFLKQDSDNRVCLFCLKEGDNGILQDSRLLYSGYNTWVHANCALWSSDVYEEFDGTLQNVHYALKKGQLIKCTLCKCPGATIKCITKTCSNYYHFHCAREAHCLFNSDKSVSCSIHKSDEKCNNLIAKEAFFVFRPLYIELDKSRRTFIEPSKVQFMMGSLSVIQLGTVYSKFSDTSEAIVPINYICARLYWSCKEPWKIVKYRVRTLIQNATLANQEKNFTVDHSKNVDEVKYDLSQVANWHSSLSCEGILDSHEYVKHSSIRLSTENDPNEFISETYIEEEPQNNSDLLPPEIKDAIFEDLPHDILDGISMLDILPKLMIYEDLIAIEGKSDNVLITEAVENRALQISENCPTYNTQESNKRSSNIINHVDDTNLSTTYPKRELQRSNSEVFLRNFEGYRSQQRSSSVTWSCKFDSTRRYFTKGLSDAGLSESRDYRLNSKKTNVIFEESNHLTQVNKDKFKLMQLDGTNDTNIEYLSTQGLNENSNSPVKCDRCHCTYRTYDSFQRHLVTCEQISTSESETETSLRSPDVLRSTTFFQDESIKNNLQFYQNPLYGNQKMSSNIPVICDPNLISSDNIIPHNIYVNNTADNQDGFFININKTGYNSDIKNNIIFNNGYDQSAYQNFGDSIVNSSNKTNNKTNKLKYNFPNSNIKDNNEQYNICSNTKQDTILAPETISTVNNKAEYNTQEKHSYLQFSNQQLVLNNQYSQKEHQQQIVVIQQSVGNNQPLFIQQVQNPTTLNQNLLPVVIPNNSMQYASISPSSNPLVHGSILQTDASGNVMLSSGLQLLSMPTIQLSSQTSPQLFGTFNQPQSVHMGSNQMIIGGTGGMELMTNSNQLILSVPPVYYGLETIVQNTVMSSQQFISTAMQGVLGQNASFSATTTQVFQSSKFEPVSDIPNGYVVLNNADGSSIMVPHSNYMSGFMTTNNAHDVQSNYSHDFGNICGTHSSTFLQQTQPNSILPLIPTLSDITSIPVENPINQIKTTVNLENNVHLKPQEKQTAKFTTTLNNAILPKNSTGIINQKSITSDVEKNSMGTNECGKRINSNLRNKAQAKQKATHKYVKRSRIPKNTQINSKIMYKNEYNLTQLNETALANLNNKTKLKIERHHKTIEETNMKCKASNYTNVGNKLPDTPNMHHNVLESHMNTDEQFGAKFTIKNNFTRPNKESTSQTFLLNSTKIQQTTHPSGSNLNNGLTNIVSPILQTHQSNNTPSRPTNRVLPMQSIHKPINNHTIKKYVFENEPSDTKSNNKALPPAQSIEQNTGENQFHEIVIKDDICETKSDNIHSVNGLNPLESIPTLNDASHLKKSDNNISIDNILLDIIKKDYQQSSKAKVNENPSSENTLRDEKVDVPNKSIIDNMYMDTQLHVKAMTQNKCLDHIKITELSKLGLKCKSPNSFEVSQQCSANVCQAISPKKRVKEGPGKVAEPYLIYEIQSDDGFSYTSKSIADIWEKVFEAVQSARRAYGISSLPIGPFADMCGVQMIGLKTNALKYLIEQLPGTDKLTKYTPKYHKNTTTNVGNEFYNQDQEDLQENNYGSVRCEPFTKRSDYDIFSWLASKHRKQPKQIFVQPSDTELIARRCTANLPMAMKYRTLKETCKHNVGVFRSLIHGRGLFCIADIEAGEMVIEYAGELIRSTLTDKRERFYDSRGIGCYMFKIDDNFVVDATMRGNAARFINHSCEPNCYSKVVDILGHKHIIIFSLRRIVQGEELTYDYKFPFEDIKIPCSCCSKKCRKYLN